MSESARWFFPAVLWIGILLLVDAVSQLLVPLSYQADVSAGAKMAILQTAISLTSVFVAGIAALSTGAVAAFGKPGGRTAGVLGVAVGLLLVVAVVAVTQAGPGGIFLRGSSPTPEHALLTWRRLLASGALGAATLLIIGGWLLWRGGSLGSVDRGAVAPSS